MAVLPPPGNKHDFYAAPNGSFDLATMPGGVVDFSPNHTPIRLQRGDGGFGAHHIAAKHGVWLDRHKKTVTEMVWEKLQQPGLIYTTEDASKLKVTMRFPPPALLLLRHISSAQPFFTVVSLYLLEGAVDGEPLGQYPTSGQTQMPAFSLPPPKPVPIITTKKPKKIWLDSGA